MGNLDFSGSSEQFDRPKRPSSSARLRQAEAERALANYEALVQNYMTEGGLDVDNGIDEAGRSVSAVIDSAREAGASVDDLVEQQSQLAARVLNTQKLLHE